MKRQFFVLIVFFSLFVLKDYSQNQRRHWNISNDGQASLTINRATRADEGLWECWELDSSGNVRQKAPIMKIVISSEYFSLKTWMTKGPNINLLNS